MVRALSGRASGTKARLGVNLTPVCLPTSVRRTPLALSSAAAEAARSSSSP